MNTYKKYCPNVFVAMCDEQHQKGEVITMTTKYGKEHKVEVHNCMGERDGKYLYSITRTDGFNAQERAKNKAEKILGWAASAERKSDEYYNKSNKDKDFLSLAEPIKVGHHSEKRHRKIIQQAWDNMGKSVELADKAKAYESRARYWEGKTSEVNLSMPESVEFFEMQLEEAKLYHLFLKDNPEQRPHSMALQYANKKVKDLTDKVQTAVKLWGDPEEVEQIETEKREQAEKKAAKSQKTQEKMEKYGVFFAFNGPQFKEGYAKQVERGIIEQGDKVTHLKAGIYIPSKNVREYLSTT